MDGIRINISVIETEQFFLVESSQNGCLLLSPFKVVAVLRNLPPVARTLLS
jgi:hypothetical protein